MYFEPNTQWSKVPPHCLIKPTFYRKFDAEQLNEVMLILFPLFSAFPKGLEILPDSAKVPYLSSYVKCDLSHAISLLNWKQNMKTRKIVVWSLYKCDYQSKSIVIRTE